MAPKAVFFDIDGTLIDSNDWHVQAWEEAFQSHGYAVERSAIHDQIGKGGDILVPSLILDADEALTNTLSDAQGAIFKEKYLARMQPVDFRGELTRGFH